MMSDWCAYSGAPSWGGFWVGVVFYVIQAIAFYQIAKKVNIRNAWVAFVPFVQFIIVLHLIDKSGWNILLLLIPLVNIVLIIIWMVKFYVAFSVSTGLIVLSIIIPIAGLIVQLVIAFSEQYSYKGSTRFTV
ncbi:MAG: hypothetical protein AMS17_02740 [Spirochaetes bacterium DG_61]|jgi:hypothetical protein|nr:MAG: hypothetical protein AMS17_02740 [Spirochaetes bacterium DG_61]